jgi:hypothetical protein
MSTKTCSNNMVSPNDHVVESPKSNSEQMAYEAMFATRRWRWSPWFLALGSPRAFESLGSGGVVAFVVAVGGVWPLVPLLLTAAL